MSKLTSKCCIFATERQLRNQLCQATSIEGDRAKLIAAAINPQVASNSLDWTAFDVQHALLKRLYEIESEACVLRSRLRAGQGKK